MSGTYSDKLLSIQLFRAIAVLFVVISHTLWEMKEMLAPLGVNVNDKLFPGDFGVDLFFVISGFIMVYATQNSSGGLADAWDYIKRRIIRIVPLYWTMTTAMIVAIFIFPLNVDTATHEPIHWLQSYLFIPFAREADGLFRPVLGLGWSLNYEMFFYGLFAIGLIFSRWKGLFLVIAMLVGLTLANLIGLITAPKLQYLVQPVILEFGFGIMIGWFYTTGVRIPVVIGMILAIGGVAGIAISPEYSLSLAPWRHIFYGIPALMLVVAITLTRNAETMRVPRAFVSAGDASYAIYLVHPFVLGLMTVLWKMTSMQSSLTSNFGSAVYMGLAIILSFTISWLVHVLYDAPLTRALANKFAGKGRSNMSSTLENRAFSISAGRN